MSREMLNECITGQVRSGFHGLCVTAMAGQVVAGVDFPDDWYIDYKKMGWTDFAEMYLHPGFEALIANFEAMIEAEVRKLIEPAMDSFFRDMDKSLGEYRETAQGLQVSHTTCELGKEGLIQHSQGPAAPSLGSPGGPEDRDQAGEGSSAQQEKV